MAKERINVTVDPSVKAELDARTDINTSGLVNDLLRAYLDGETTHEAGDRVKLERLKEEEKELREEANAKERQRKEIKQRLQKEAEEERQSIEEAANVLKVYELKSQDQPLIEQSEDQIRTIANQVGVDPKRLKDEALRQYEESNTTDKTFQ